VGGYGSHIGTGHGAEASAPPGQAEGEGVGRGGAGAHEAVPDGRGRPATTNRRRRGGCLVSCPRISASDQP